MSRISDKDLEFYDIIRSAYRTPTDPEDYRKALKRIMERDPTMTIDTLSQKLGKSRAWLLKVLKGYPDQQNPDVCACPMLKGGGINHVESCTDR